MTEANPIIHTPQKVLKPEDISLDDLRHLSKDEFALWALTSGVKVDSNDIDFNNHRYLLPIYMDNSKEIVWQKAAQLGATVYMILRILWWLESHQGRKAGLYFPTKEGVENLSKDRLTPLINSCPSIANMTDMGDKLGLRKIGTSSFYLYHLGGVASKDSTPLDFLAFDEVRLCSAQDVDQALERVSHSPYKYKMFMSTAGDPNGDINARFLDGTQHVWMSSCFDLEQQIVVRRKTNSKVSTPPELMTLRKLQNNWFKYQALSCDVQHKKLQYRDITAFHDNGEAEVVEVLFDDGSTVICTTDHEFAWHNGKPIGQGAKTSFTSISKLHDDPRYNKNNLLAARTFATEQFEEQIQYDLLTYYVFGAYLAEGSWPTDTIIEISQLRDKPIWYKVQQWAELHGLAYKVNDRNVRVSLHTRPDLLEVFLSFGKGCDQKHISSWVMNGSTQQLSALLEGYIDGDGSRKSSGYWEIATTSEELSREIQFVAMRAGYSTRRKFNKVYDGKKPCWTVSYSPNVRREVDPLSEHIGTAKVVEIRPLNTQRRVADITVDRNHNYVLANGFIVHNCGCPDGVDLARTFPDCVIEDPERGLYLRCPKCKYVIKDPQNGRYVAHNPDAPYHSYHVSQLASKYISLEEIWTMWKRTTNLEEFYKAKLGLPYIDEANRGVTKEQCEAAIDESQTWGRDKKNHCAMGVDQGAGYCMAIISDMYEDKKRIRHVEIIEQNNPDYIVAGRRVTPFNRLRELMKEFNVRLCVVDAMPNVNDAISFAQDFPGRVFLAHYSKDSKEIVQWTDKAKYKPTVAKAGPLLKFKYSCVLGRFPAISVALGAWQQGDVVMPHPDRLKQMCTDEKTGQIQPEAPARRMISHLTKLIKRFRVTNEETGEGKHEWTHVGADHLCHAWVYCNVALERLRRTVIFTFA